MHPTQVGITRMRDPAPARGAGIGSPTRPPRVTAAVTPESDSAPGRHRKTRRVGYA